MTIQDVVARLRERGCEFTVSGNGAQAVCAEPGVAHLVITLLSDEDNGERVELETTRWGGRGSSYRYFPLTPDGVEELGAAVAKAKGQSPR